jgi:hypothetical protein
MFGGIKMCAAQPEKQDDIPQQQDQTNKLKDVALGSNSSGDSKN